MPHDGGVPQDVVRTPRTKHAAEYVLVAFVLDCQRCGQRVHWIPGEVCSLGHWAHAEPAPMDHRPRCANRNPLSPERASARTLDRLVGDANNAYWPHVGASGTLPGGDRGGFGPCCVDGSNQHPQVHLYANGPAGSADVLWSQTLNDSTDDGTLPQGYSFPPRARPAPSTWSAVPACPPATGRGVRARSMGARRAGTG
jgi:hypothetical protein